MVSNEQYTFEDQLDGQESASSPLPPADPDLKYRDSAKKAAEKKKRQARRLAIVAAVFTVVCIVITILSSSGTGRVFPVYISEILASNTQYPNRDGRCCDYIELHNGADYAVDLTGFQLGDIAGNNRYLFPSGTTIGPGEYLVIYCDKTVADPTYAQFGISRAGGETFCLLGTNNAIIDSVVTIPTDLDEAMILENGEWVATSTVTPGRSNDSTAQESTDLYNEQVSPVRITELSAANTGYSKADGVHCDWVELHNTGSETVDISGFSLSDNVGVDKYIFPQGSVLSPGAYLVVNCSDEVRSDTLAPFGLSQYGGESVVLKNAGGMIVEIVECLPMSDGESLALTDDNKWEVTSQTSPGFVNSEAGHTAYLQSIGMGSRSVVISEVMSAAQAILPNSYGTFTDWVELCNVSSEAVDITGWYLSDNPNDPDKWEFPQTVLQPGQRIIVFCSGRDAVRDGELHTGFSLSASGETLVLSSFMGLQADSVTFGASEDGCSFTFNGAGAEAVATQYPTPGYPNDDIGYADFCASLTAKGPLAIWEVMTSNDWYLPQALGACYDWVEIRNVSDEAIKLSDYALTDDPDSPLMYPLPDKTLQPGKSIVIILSGDETLSTTRYSHAGFTLNAQEDQLFLYKTDGSLLDYVYLKDIPVGYSYGRSDTAGGFYFMKPTPNASNNDGNLQISAEPTSNIAAGVHTGSTGFDVPFSAIGTIYYTTDGSDPDTSSLKYEGPIRVEKTSVIRAVAVEPGKLPSDIYTLTFVISEPHSIPVVSLVTDPSNLWGANGIYKNGDITIKEEKRSANISYAGEDGSFSMDCEISLHGATTVTAFEKKSFSVRFQEAYDGRLNYDVFEDGEVTVFKSLILRNAYEDSFSSYIRDILMHYTATQVSDTLICQKHKFVAVYLNGEYWGLYAFRELHSEEHYASYMDVPASTVTMVKSYFSDHDDLQPYYLHSREGGLYNTEKAWADIKANFDLTSFADWIIFQAYVGNFDIHGNVRYYRSSADGLWRAALCDLDLGMFKLTAFDEVAGAFHHGYFMSALMKNPEFKQLLATRLAELLAGPMSDESMIANIDMLAASIRDEIPMERDRWGSNAAQWEKMIRQLKDYCDGRAVDMIYSLCGQLGFSKAQRAEYFGEILAHYGRT